MAVDVKISVLDKDSAPEKIRFMGGKAANLYLLSHNNIPVPEWFCIGYDIFEEITSPKTDEIKNILSQINFDSIESIKTASSKIYGIIETLELPDNLIKSVNTEIEKIGKNNYFAVRSSAVGEDSANDSFAGQFDTFLYITADKVHEFIKKCMASAFNPRILSYLHIKALNISEVKISVIIQKMAESEKSGVIFMANPAGSFNEIAIVAGYGLGEGIVSDQVETDRYFYSRTDKKINQFVENKSSKIVFDKNSGFGTVKVQLTEDSDKPVLDEKQLKELIDTGLKIEKLYDHYQDIEWAFDTSGKLYITQSRPITTIPRGEKTIFDNSNIVESYPGITSPLTYSYIKYAYEILFRNLLKSLGIPSQRIFDNPTVLKNMVGYIEGRVYYNLSNWYRMFRMIPGTKKYIEVWEEMMGISESTGDNKSFDYKYWLSNAPELSRVLFRLTKTFIFLDSGMKEFKSRFNSVYNDFWKIDFSKISNHDLIRTYRDLGSKLFYGWEITLINDGYAFIFTSLSKNLLKKAGLNEDIFNDLLCGDKGMESVEPVRSIVKIAELVRSDEELQSVLKSIPAFLYERKEVISSSISPDFEKGLTHGILHMLNQAPTPFPIHNSEGQPQGIAPTSPVTSYSGQPQGILHMLNQAPTFPSLFQTLFESHLQKYGDRVLGELKLETDSYRDKPEELIKLILSYVPTSLSIKEMETKEADVRTTAEKIIAEKLKYKPLRKLILNLVLKYAKRAVRYRESSRLDRARSFGMIRKIFRTIALNLYINKALEKPEDIYYLTVEEIADYIYGGSLNQNFQKIIDERKNLEKSYKEKSPAERIITQGEPYLNFIVQKASPEHGKDDLLRGTGCSPGIVTAEAVIIKDPSRVTDINGKILVSEMTDPGWVFLMIVAGGLVVEKGSLLSHTAIIGRELGIPTIVGVKNATRIIENSSVITINGQTGEITT